MRGIVSAESGVAYVDSAHSERIEKRITGNPAVVNNHSSSRPPVALYSASTDASVSETQVIFVTARNSTLFTRLLV